MVFRKGAACYRRPPAANASKTKKPGLSAFLPAGRKGRTFDRTAQDGGRLSKTVVRWIVDIADLRKTAYQRGLVQAKGETQLVQIAVEVAQLGVDIAEQDGGVAGQGHDKPLFRGVFRGGNALSVHSAPAGSRTKAHRAQVERAGAKR